MFLYWDVSDHLTNHDTNIQVSFIYLFFLWDVYRSLSMNIALFWCVDRSLLTCVCRSSSLESRCFDTCMYVSFVVYRPLLVYIQGSFDVCLPQLISRITMHFTTSLCHVPFLMSIDLFWFMYGSFDLYLGLFWCIYRSLFTYVRRRASLEPRRFDTYMNVSFDVYRTLLVYI